ncbi:type II and III secretion system protein family protein [Inquilinus sp. Marseille-Q2685]|uniref:type II and III secretion system protein family protein n=1 Tax=Inquilinus sp. Marseille-Q2685 TaxID=2866581 RepID=UPI001CE44F6C|nr:type II and III secretion system protein family protein [Inquilinus sp. Marseille-Q2685]
MRFVVRMLCVAVLVLVAQIAGAEELRLGVGAQRVLNLPAPITRIVVGQGGIIDATALNEDQLQITGLQSGKTTLSIFTAQSDQGVSYDVTVGGAAVALPTIPDRGDPARQIRGQPGLQGVRVSRDGDTLVMSGTVPDLDAHARASSIARAYGGGNVVDLTRVTGNQMVAVDIQFAAVSATTLRALGFNFAALGGSDFQGAIVGPNSLQSFEFNGAGLSLEASAPLASAFNLFLGDPRNGILGILSALSQAGLTQLLAQPTLLVRSGDQAEFLAGGEVPIPVPQGGASIGTVTIEYHEYGVKLEIAPVVMSDKRIVLKVAPEVSELDFANALEFQGFSVPAFRRRSTSTTVELGNGQSFVLAGLMYSNSQINESKFPWLGDIPILGALFKSTNNQQERQELIIVATPRLVTPLSPGQIPPLPGVDTRKYNPTVGDMILNVDQVQDHLAPYGLMR